MRKVAISTIVVAAAAALVLSGCSSRGSSAESSGSAAAGFPANSMIGVALPAKTSENWVLAGQLFTDGLTEAGFTPNVQYAAATGTVADQQNQINSMITSGAKVLIIGAADGGQLGAQLQQAHDAGVKVISYDRLITNTPNVDYYVGFNATKVGELQAQSLLEGMKARKPNGPYNIELFSGSPDDANSAIFFNGAMSVLQPKIDDGTLKVVSGQTDIKQTATAGWLAQNAQSRMDTILAANYTDTELDGVLSPNDTLARAILTSVKSAGKPLPIVTGQDSEEESVKSIMAGEQYSTIYKDTRAIVAQSIKTAQALQQGQAPEINDTTSFNNGAKTMQSFLLEPIIVIKENAAQVYANNPTLEALTQ